MESAKTLGIQTAMDDGAFSTAVPWSKHVFLVHSQSSVGNNEAPNVDDKPLARQRRRRTSPEDQLILEAAYHQNARPDRNARSKIVERVSLGEKEVQIWFQNRRQSSRRKIQPLQQLDSAWIECNSAPAHTASPAGESFENDLTPRPSNSQGSQTVDAAQDENASHLESTHTSSDSSQTENKEMACTSADGNGSESIKSGLQSTFSANLSSQESQGRASDSTLPQSSSQGTPSSTPQSTGYLANRRSAMHTQVLQLDVATNSTDSAARTDVAQLERTLHRSSSSLRLALTSEGIAQVVRSDEQDEIPDILPSVSRDSMIVFTAENRPSSTAVDRTFPYNKNNRNERRRQKLVKGRSSDSRAWEFWCDSDARNSLAEKAEKDQSGSAADAIGLMRSNSRTKRPPLLKRRHTDKTTLEIDSDNGTGRRGSLSVVPNLKKSVSLLDGTKPMKTATTKHSYTESNRERLCTLENDRLSIFSTESDKENWDPETRKSGKPIALQAKGALRTLPPSSKKATAPVSSANRRRNNPHTADDVQPTKKKIGIQARPVLHHQSSASTTDDIFCVEGLLSLRQGVWQGQHQCT